MALGYVEILTRRASGGIAKCEHALELDRNLANAHSFIGLGKVCIGRAKETEAHIGEALRLSPHDMLAYNWMTYAGNSEPPPRQLRGNNRMVATVDRSQPKLFDSVFPAGRRAHTDRST